MHFLLQKAVKESENKGINIIFNMTECIVVSKKWISTGELQIGDAKRKNIQKT